MSGLIGLEKPFDRLVIDSQVGVGDKLIRQRIDAREAGYGQDGELAEVALRQVELHVAGVALDNILVVEQPFGGR